MVWQRISYFGDALSHAIMLGLAAGAMFKINPVLAITIFAIIFAALVFFTSRNSDSTKDSSVMISSYFSIALAMILNDLWIHNLDFFSYIFGDILAVGINEIIALALINLLAISYAIFGTKKIMLINLNSDLAKISGIKSQLWELSFLVLLAITIAITTHVIGIFLTTALLVLPAAISRIFARSAKNMIFLSIFIGLICSIFSFCLANEFNLTVGPVMISAFCVIFFLSRAAQSLRK